ncbi:MAG: GNAT family N-acetyltransferase [Candidatus Cloacimonetes bacterium]|nr:GNAT family N-acetyltransferase [Candidatus Cloacimonadota bacterium]
MQFREIQKADYPLLEFFLYHAIYFDTGFPPPPRDIIFRPEIYIYVKDFGGIDDCGVVAENAGKIVGMAWTRIIAGYGHIDNDTPELAISILPEFRRQGIGTKLMKYLFELLRQYEYKQTSLSVHKENPAYYFYERLGYKVIGEKIDDTNDDYLMMKNL